MMAMFVQSSLFNSYPSRITEMHIGRITLNYRSTPSFSLRRYKKMQIGQVTYKKYIDH